MAFLEGNSSSPLGWYVSWNVRGKTRCRGAEPYGWNAYYDDGSEGFGIYFSTIEGYEGKDLTLLSSPRFSSNLSRFVGKCEVVTLQMCGVAGAFVGNNVVYLLYCKVPCDN